MTTMTLSRINELAKEVLEIEAKIKVLQSEINGTEQQYYTSKAIFEQFSDKQLSLYFKTKYKINNEANIIKGI